MEASNSKIVLHDVPPYLKVYVDGTIERFIGTEKVPATLDPHTGVISKDVVFLPESGVSARLYRPTNPAAGKKLPLVIYFHGGAFCISSSADPKIHNMLNILVNEAQILLISVDYRLAPENPLPTAYDDSWAALKWAATAAEEIKTGAEIWLTESADFERVFLAGESAGANISHHLAIRVGSDKYGSDLKLKISGVLMIQPYFWGEEPIGVEAENPVIKSVVDKWWRFVCPSDRGCDDPWINPFADGAPDVGRLGCDRVLVCVAGNDVLRERGKLYYQSLVKSKLWKGKKAEFVLTEGEDHVFHILDPTAENSKDLIKRCAKFINGE